MRETLIQIVHKYLHHHHDVANTIEMRNNKKVKMIEKIKQIHQQAVVVENVQFNNLFFYYYIILRRKWYI